jgi:hypothetical protein
MPHIKTSELIEGVWQDFTLLGGSEIKLSENFCGYY